MPRSRTIRRSRKTKKKQSFLPESLQAFIARRLVDIIASAFLLFGLFSALAILSYDQADPSWNTASAEDQNIANWMGETGAFIADLLIQPFGIASILISAACIIWGARMFKRHIVSPFFARIIALSAACLFTAIACAQIPSDWTPHAYLGGAIGTLTFNAVSKIAQGFTSAAMWAIIPLSAIIGLTTFLYAAAVTRAELTFAFNITRKITGNILLLCINGMIAFRNWIKHYNDPSYVAEPLFKLDFSLPHFDLMPQNNAAQKAPIRSNEDYDEPAQTAPSAPTKPAAKSEEPQMQSSIPVLKPKQGKNTKPNTQGSFNLDGGDWELPSLSLIHI